MRNIIYEFVDLDSEESFHLLGEFFGGVLQKDSLHFENDVANGELIKKAPDKGLWLRKWKFNVYQQIILRKLPAPASDEKKLHLIYFLNPAIFTLKNNTKKIHINSHRNILFYSSSATMDFSVIPRQPFYVLDVSVTASWLLQQFGDAAGSFKEMLVHYINSQVQTMMIEPCSAEEYKTLHEIDILLSANNEDNLFVRSRVYRLISAFFEKLFKRDETDTTQGVVHYEQIMYAEMMLMADIKNPPKVEALAKKANMSVSSLLRQFKLIYGKSVYEYYVERKMELAKRLLLENKIAVKETAEMLGYKQASHFIETFTKLHGYSPGLLRSFRSYPTFS